MRLDEDASIERGGNYTEPASKIFPSAGNFSEIFLKAIMSSGPRHLYEFGPFVLDPAERTLLRDGSRIQIRPKVFDTLLVLVENGGHLVEKDELMRAVWPEQFVEEGNLNKTVSNLRQALGEGPAQHRYIETVPKRGFRFVADVREVNGGGTREVTVETRTRASLVFEEETDEEKPGAEDLTRSTRGPRYLVSWIKRHKLPVAFGLAILSISAIALAGWFARSSRTAFEAPILSAPFALEKLSTNGKVQHAVISPDGKNVIYTNITTSEKWSVWLRQFETGNNVEIIPPSDNIYFGLAYAPDGDSLYFARRPQNIEGQADIYRVSVFGGIPQKLVSETQGWIGVSPEGKRISFVRCYYRDDDYCSLWVADSADGRNEKKLITRPRPFRIGDNEFSPDGKHIAFAAGQSQNASDDFNLLAVDVESGAERQLTTEKFFNIKSLAWLPDQLALLLTATRISDKKYRIWQVSAATGNVEPLTKDSESYSALSLDQKTSRLVSTQFKHDFRLRVSDLKNASNGFVLADAPGVTFAPSGKIFYTSKMSGNEEIWSVNPNGGGQRQLTNDAADDYCPIVAPDNSAIYFASNRSGVVHAWRMNEDGSNQTQVTHKTGGFPLFVSPDGEWLYYHHGIDRTLWRVSTSGGEEQIVLNKSKYRFALSPDGALVAFNEKIGDENFIVIVSLEGAAQTIKSFKYAHPKGRLFEIAWMPDGNGIVYILADKENRRNVLWLQPFGGEEPRKLADLGDEQISELSGLALAPDGKSFAVAQGGWLHDVVLLKGLK